MWLPSTEAADSQAAVTVGCPPAALGWGECLDTRDLSAIGSLTQAAPPQSGILASGTAVYFGLCISPSLPMTPHDKSPLQELAQECNISRLQMNFKQTQHTAQLLVLESNTEGDKKFPLQPGAESDGHID